MNEALALLKIDWSLPDQLLIRFFRQLLLAARKGNRHNDAALRCFHPRLKELPKNFREQYNERISKGLRPLIAINAATHEPVIEITIIVLRWEKTDNEQIRCFKAFLHVYRPHPPSFKKKSAKPWLL